MLKRKNLAFTLFLLLIAGISEINAQTTILLGQDTTKRPLVPAVPFLAIAPDARSTGMGEAAVAVSPDANAIYWNPAKLAFVDKKYGFSFSYSPWLRNLVNDMYLAFLSGYYRLDDKQTFALALRYFNLGDIQFTDISGNQIRDFNPREFSFTGSYSRKLSEKIGLAINGRFIFSNLSANIILPNQQESKAGITGAVDVAFFYRNQDLKVAQKPASLAFGVNISNIGAKISYSNENEQDFIPTNLRIGSAFTMSLDPLE
ncbi:MAG: type IX secretion system outer membrane channel protein PorV, partial [Bacteroidota bacterium]